MASARTTIHCWQLKRNCQTTGCTSIRSQTTLSHELQVTYLCVGWQAVKYVSLRKSQNSGFWSHPPRSSIWTNVLHRVHLWAGSSPSDIIHDSNLCVLCFPTTTEITALNCCSRLGVHQTLGIRRYSDQDCCCVRPCHFREWSNNPVPQKQPDLLDKFSHCTSSLRANRNLAFSSRAVAPEDRMASAQASDSDSRIWFSKYLLGTNFSCQFPNRLLDQSSLKKKWYCRIVKQDRLSIV